MKDTAQAETLAFVSINLDSGECKLEKVLFKETGQEQIRFSLLRPGETQHRSVSFSEQELATLLRAAIRKGILSQNFVGDLQSVVEI